MRSAIKHALLYRCIIPRTCMPTMMRSFIVRIAARTTTGYTNAQHLLTKSNTGRVQYSPRAVLLSKLNHRSRHLLPLISLRNSAAAGYRSIVNLHCCGEQRTSWRCHCGTAYTVYTVMPLLGPGPIMGTTASTMSACTWEQLAADTESYRIRNKLATKGDFPSRVPCMCVCLP